MKVLIVHGWGADCSSNWFPWLKIRLEKLGIECLCPNLPNAQFPKKEEWIEELRAQTCFLEKEKAVLVGHSLGCPAILRLLESFKEGEKARAAILVSGFARDVGILQIRNFTDGGFDFQKIRISCRDFYVINSDNDPYVQLEEGKLLAKALNTKLITEKGAGHINGFFKAVHQDSDASPPSVSGSVRNTRPETGNRRMEPPSNARKYAGLGDGHPEYARVLGIISRIDGAIR